MFHIMGYPVAGLSRRQIFPNIVVCWWIDPEDGFMLQATKTQNMSITERNLAV